MRETRETIPRLCPVCNGRGIVPQGFYLPSPNFPISTTAPITEQCKSCSGSGIIYTEKVTTIKTPDEQEINIEP